MAIFHRNFALAVLSLLPLGGCASSLLLHPSTEPLDAGHARAAAIPFSGGVLQIWKCRDDPSADAGAIVVEFVGNASRAEGAAAVTAHLWRGVNAEVWAVNYPGFGGSSGKASVSAIPPAALAAFDAAASGAAGKPVLVVGRSIGTTAALYVAARRPVAGVMLHSPTPLTRVIVGRFGWWNLWIGAAVVAAQVPPELDGIRNARLCSAPGVFIVSEKDRLVVPAHQRLVIDSYRGERTVITLPTAGHDSPASAAEKIKIEAAIEWLVASARFTPLSKRLSHGMVVDSPRAAS